MERFWRTIQAATTCCLAGLPFVLPDSLHKYAIHYCVEQHNLCTNTATAPLTPAILFAGRRGSTKDFAFGTTALIRTGKQKRNSEGHFSKKAELGVYLGPTGPRMDIGTGRFLLANGKVVARSTVPGCPTKPCWVPLRLDTTGLRSLCQTCDGPPREDANH